MRFIVILAAVRFICHIFRTIMLNLKSQNRLVMNCILYGIRMETFSI